MTKKNQSTKTQPKADQPLAEKKTTAKTSTKAAKTTASSKKVKQTTAKAHDHHHDHHDHNHDHDHGHNHPHKKSELIADNTSIKLVIPWPEVKKAYQQALQKESKNIKMKGFRQGKAPSRLAEAQLGRPQLIEKALEIVLPAVYQQEIEKSKKKPLTQPEIKPLSLEWGKDWELEALIAEKPEIKLGQFKTVIKKAKKKAEKTLKEIAKQAEKAAKAAKDKKASQPTKPNEHEIREANLQHIFRDLVEAIKPAIPELLLKTETRNELERLAQELKKVGMTLDDFLKRKQQTFEQLSSEVAVQVLSRLQLGFILEAIEVAEKVEATAEDIKQELDKMKDKAMKSQIEKVPYYQNYLKQQIVRRKLIDHLLKL